MWRKTLMTEQQRKVSRWLNRGFDSWKEVKALEMSIEALDAIINKCVGTYDPPEIQLNPSGNQQEERLVRRGDLAEILERKARKLLYEDGETAIVINKLDDTVTRTILIHRFINRKKWSEVSKLVHMSDRQCYRRQLDALDDLYKYIPWI